MNSGENGIVINENITAEHFLLDTDSEVLSSNDTVALSDNSLLTSPLPQSADDDKVSKQVIKRGRPKKKKPKKYVIEVNSDVKSGNNNDNDNDIGNNENTSGIYTIVLPEISESGYVTITKLIFLFHILFVGMQP